MASRTTYIPVGYVPVVTAATPARVALFPRDVVAFATPSTTGSLSARIDNVTVALANTGLALVAVNTTGTANITLTGVTAFPPTVPPGTATVWRAPTRWEAWKPIAHPVAAGTCPISGAGFSECVLPDAAVKTLATAAGMLRAGFVTSGAVVGTMNDTIPASDRRNIVITTGNGAGLVTAQHGYLLETRCTKASPCTVLGATLPASVGGTYALSLGWAVYDTVVPAPPPARPSAPTIASAMGRTAYIEVAVCGSVLLIALIVSILVCRCAVRASKGVSKKKRVQKGVLKKAVVEEEEEEGSDADEAGGEREREQTFQWRRNNMRLRI